MPASTPESRAIIKKYFSGDVWFGWNTSSYLALPTDAKTAGDTLVQWGMRQVIFKGTQDGNNFVNSNGRENLTPEWITSVMGEGVLSVGFYSFYTGIKPETAAAATVKKYNQLAPVGAAPFVILDVETIADTTGPKSFDIYQKIFRQELPGVALLGCSWALPQYHNRKLMELLAQSCDSIMPMVYWPGNSAQNAQKLLTQSYAQWRQVDPTIGNNTEDWIPVLRAYAGDGGKPAPDATTAGRDWCMKKGLFGCAHYSPDWLIRYGPGYGMTKEFVNNLPAWTTADINAKQAFAASTISTGVNMIDDINERIYNTFRLVKELMSLVNIIR